MTEIQIREALDSARERTPVLDDEVAEQREKELARRFGVVATRPRGFFVLTETGKPDFMPPADRIIAVQGLYSVTRPPERTQEGPNPPGSPSKDDYAATLEIRHSLITDKADTSRIARSLHTSYQARDERGHTPAYELAARVLSYANKPAFHYDHNDPIAQEDLLGGDIVAEFNGDEITLPFLGRAFIQKAGVLIDDVKRNGDAYSLGLLPSVAKIRPQDRWKLGEAPIYNIIPSKRYRENRQDFVRNIALLAVNTGMTETAFPQAV